MMQTILVGYDDSEQSQRALERAATLARALTAELYVTSVAPVGTSAGRSMGVDPVESKEEHQAELHEAHVYLEGQGVTAKDVESVGHEAESILAAARKHSADLIVVGARELSGVQRLLGQSVSDAVAHGASCDVLIVH